VTLSDSVLVGGLARIDIDQTQRQLQRTERDGSRLGFDWSNELRLTPQHTLIFGLETERESVERVALAEAALDATLRATFTGDTIPFDMQSISIRQLARQRQAERLRNHAAFVGDVFRYERVFGEVALRLNDHDDYGSGFSYRVALGYQDPGSRLRVFASVATGFRDPDVIPSADLVFLQSQSRQSTPSDGLDLSFSDSLVDAGDRTLERSVSRGFELGFELPLLDDRLTVGATAFASRVRGLQTNEFSFVFIDPSGRLQITQPFSDSAQARIRGVELAASWQASSWLRARADYTYTHSELAHVPPTPGIFISDDIGAVRLVRPSGTDLTGVPRQRINLSVEATPYEGVTLGFALRHVGERKDNFFTRSESLGGYTVYDVAASYRMSQRVELFARVENLFDKEYNDLRLAEQPGIAGYLGVRARY
jgi:vitamin B12 transporter